MAAVRRSIFARNKIEEKVRMLEGDAIKTYLLGLNIFSKLLNLFFLMIQKL